MYRNTVNTAYSDDGSDGADNRYLDLLDQIDFHISPVVKGKVLFGIGSLPVKRDCLGLSVLAKPSFGSDWSAPSETSSRPWCEVAVKPGHRWGGAIRKVAFSSKDMSVKLFCKALSVPHLPLFKFKMALGAAYAPGSSSQRSGVPFKWAVHWSLSTVAEASGVRKFKKKLGPVQARATTRFSISMPSFEGGMGELDVDLGNIRGSQSDFGGLLEVSKVGLVWHVNDIYSKLSEDELEEGAEAVVDEAAVAAPDAIVAAPAVPAPSSGWRARRGGGAPRPAVVATEVVEEPAPAVASAVVHSPARRPVDGFRAWIQGIDRAVNDAWTSKVVNPITDFHASVFKLEPVGGAAPDSPATPRHDVKRANALASVAASAVPVWGGARHARAGARAVRRPNSGVGFVACRLGALGLADSDRKVVVGLEDAVWDLKVTGE